MARRQHFYGGVAPYKTVRAVVSRPAGLAAADEVVATAVARASIEADLALLEGLCGVYEEQRCYAHGVRPNRARFAAR